MAGASGVSVRQPAVAGLFYPAEREACRRAVNALLQPNRTAQIAEKKFLGAIVPHAGWICSGAIAGEAISTLAASTQPDIVVVFGAVHSAMPLHGAALDASDRWAVPNAVAAVADEIRAKLGEASTLFTEDERFHRKEHAVEVELPLIAQAWPDAAILPVEVATEDAAIDIGRRAAHVVKAAGLKPVYLASSDLTHYGPNYDFAPAGVGEEALAWAKDNDRRLLELVTKLLIEQIVPEVRQSYNACGGGAIAAMLSACREHGASEASVLRHANSYETLAEVAPQRPDNAVGYAGVVVG